MYHTNIAESLQLSTSQVKATIDLLAEGATVPFISRYRKEMTGSLDEIKVTAIRELVSKFTELDKRRKAIIESLSSRDLLSNSLKQSLLHAKELVTLEDIYLPYKQKRKTRALIAREKGLEALA
ncbi:MAG: RNA-binding transcriptional accessory protein, partial [Desulfocapsa sp.]|nr:RNA-binding transcriptional accessory protein [Desulfocapsa sp.]